VVSQTEIWRGFATEPFRPSSVNSLVSMKTITRSFLLAAAFAAALVAKPVQAAAETGKAAPDFELKDITGKTVKLSDYKGKVVVLEWVNSGCPIVQRHYSTQNMQNTQRAATADGVVWLQINSGHKGAQGDLSDADSAAWLKKMNAASTAYMRDQTGAVGKLYNAKATPHMYVIDQKGTLVYQGAIDDKPTAKGEETLKAHNYVNAALQSVKAGKPVEKANTQAYGCDVKYGS
jgi:peroxiredoxin